MLFCVVLPLVHKKLYGPVPLEAVAVAEPCCVQPCGRTVVLELRTVLVELTVTVLIFLHPILSVTVTV